MSTPALPSLEQVIEQVTAERKAAAPAVAQVTKEEAPAAPTEEQVVAAVENAPAAEEVVSEAVVPEKKDPVSSQFAAMARKEREIRERSKQIEAREKAAEARLKEAEAKLAELSSKDEKYGSLKKSPLKMLKELGISYQDVTNDALGQYEAPAADPLDERLSPLSKQQQEIQKQLDELKQRQIQIDQREAQNALREVMDTIEETVNGSEDYELVQSLGSQGHEMVKDLLSMHFQQNNELLTYAEACSMIEEQLEQAYVTPFLNTKKVKSRLSTTADNKASTAPTKQSQPQESSAPKTLTNQRAVAPNATRDIDKMSKQEAIDFLKPKIRYHD